LNRTEFGRFVNPKKLRKYFLSIAFQHTAGLVAVETKENKNHSDIAKHEMLFFHFMSMWIGDPVMFYRVDLRDKVQTLSTCRTIRYFASLYKGGFATQFGTQSKIIRVL
jgi:hypothetical protein